MKLQEVRRLKAEVFALRKKLRALTRETWAVQESIDIRRDRDTRSLENQKAELKAKFKKIENDAIKIEDKLVKVGW